MSDMINKGKTKRLLHLDILRVLAIFLVIFNHTGGYGYTLFAKKLDSFMCFPYMAFSVFSKIAVPIFFMISGALLLPRQESFKQLFCKRILRMLVVLVLISVPYYYWLHIEEGIGISSFLTYIYGNSASTSLWYLYSHIGLLLLLPFLRSMVKNMQEKDFIYLIIGHIVLVGVLPCLQYCLWGRSVTINPSFSSAVFVTQNIFFALVGYYLEHIFNKKDYTKKKALISVILSAFSIVVTCLITYYQMIVETECSVEQLESFFNCFICIPAITVYLLIKFSSIKIKGEKIQKAVSIFGASVFGVYLIEKILRALTSSVYTLLAPTIGSFIASLIWRLTAFCLSFLIVIPLKHIPIIKKLVNMFI